LSGERKRKSLRSVHGLCLTGHHCAALEEGLGGHPKSWRVLALVTIPLSGKEVGTAPGKMLGPLLGDPSDSKGRDIYLSTRETHPNSLAGPVCGVEI
jgi:hypothetical protein